MCTLLLFSGRGKWKEIATLIPTRSTIQVKTHAQMVMKRVEAGEDVFAEYEETLAPNSRGRQEGDDIGHRYSINMPAPTSSSHVDTSKVYDSLSHMDQGAVQILFQMAQVRAVCVL